MNIVVLVPYRPDRGHRDRIWAHLQTHYWEPTGYRVVVGEHRDGPFNRSKAINHAADTDWDVAVIADSDTYVPEVQLAQAINTAHETGRLCAAFTHVAELTKDCTEKILTGQTPCDMTVERIRSGDLETQSSMLTIRRDLWDRTGFDERFCGWGGEDNAFWKHCALTTGQPERIPGPALHLWHRPAADKRKGVDYRRNLALWQRYNQATDLCSLQRA